MTTTWKTQIELPAIAAISDDCAWVTVRGSEFDDRDKALEFYRTAKSGYEFPLRFVRSVKFGEGGATVNEYENE